MQQDEILLGDNLDHKMSMIEKFIARIDRLEERYKKDKFASSYLVPADELKAVRDELKEPSLKLC